MGRGQIRIYRASMRNTCHAIEALDLLDIPAYTRDHVQEGVAWLVNLSTMSDASATEIDYDHPRWHPSRFKTLAWLSHFDEPIVQADFARVAQNLDESGLLRNVHPRHLLATLIYLDTLQHLAQNTTLPDAWEQGRAQALEAIRREVEVWWDNPSNAAPFVSLQEVSYALDLLISHGRMAATDGLAEAIRHTLVEELDTQDEGRLLSPESLYFGIQLSRHFRDHPQTVEQLQHVRRVLRSHYQAGTSVRSDDVSFHSLVLRLQITFHQQLLREAIFRLLYRTHEATFISRTHAREEEFHNELRALLSQQVTIGIRNSHALGGGMRADGVFYVEFDVSIRMPNITSEHPAFRSEPQHIVVKTGPATDLEESIARYKQLPPSITAYFATHMHTPFRVASQRGNVGYLIMEDLLPMQTLLSLLESWDVQMLTARQNQSMLQAIEDICIALHAIHLEHVAQPDHFAGDQLSRLYLAPIEQAAVDLGRRHSRFRPELRKLHFNGKAYRSLNYYLGILQQRTVQIRPASLCLVHGDCHTGNIMLDQSARKVAFIDLDHVSSSGDYIDDYATLMEDACIYRFLRDSERNNHIKPTDINEQLEEHTTTEWTCTHQVFRNQLSCRFQTALLERIEAHAESVQDDAAWRQRLWLATAARLIRLAARTDSLHYAVFLYAEGIRLIDALCIHLAQGLPLPALLFYHPSEKIELISTPHAQLESIVKVIRREVREVEIISSGHKCEFRVGAQLVGLIFPQKGRLRLALAALPEEVVWPFSQVSPFASGNLMAVVDIPSGEDEISKSVISVLRELTS